MKKLLSAILILTLTAPTLSAEDLDFRSSKYIVNCSISISIKQPDLSDGSPEKSFSDISIFIADDPNQPYTTDIEKVQRVYFRVDGGTALSLYQLCKEKLNSKDKRASLYAIVSQALIPRGLA